MTWLVLRVMRLPEEPPNCPPERRPPRSMQRWLEKAQEAGYVTYYPMVSEMRRVPKNRLSKHMREQNIMRPAVVPFLPSLVFVHDEPGATSIAYLPGAIGFMMMGEIFAPVSEAWIDKLRGREKLGGGAIPGGTPAEYVFELGEHVETVHPALGTVEAKVTVVPSCPIEEIDADTRLELAIGQFRVSARVSDVRKL